MLPDFEGKNSLLNREFSRYAIPFFDSIHSFDALLYRLDLNIPMQSYRFSGSMTMQFQVVFDNLSQINLNMVRLVTDSVFLNGIRTTFNHDDSLITIQLGGFHHPPETLAVQVFYQDTLPNRGFYFDGRDAYTFAEPLDARWWFPCFDEPWDKATSEIFCTVPDTDKVGSNGFLESVSHDTQNHTFTYHWVNNYQIATYLINLIIGDYAVWNDYYISSVTKRAFLCNPSRISR